MITFVREDTVFNTLTRNNYVLGQGSPTCRLQPIARPWPIHNWAAWVVGWRTCNPNHTSGGCQRSQPYLCKRQHLGCQAALVSLKEHKTTAPKTSPWQKLLQRGKAWGVGVISHCFRPSVLLPWRSLKELRPHLKGFSSILCEWSCTCVSRPATHMAQFPSPPQPGRQVTKVGDCCFRK